MFYYLLFPTCDECGGEVLMVSGRYNTWHGAASYAKADSRYIVRYSDKRYELGDEFTDEV